MAQHRSLGASGSRLSFAVFTEDYQFIGYFDYVTRIADGFGVEPEDVIQPLGARSGVDLGLLCGLG